MIVFEDICKNYVLGDSTVHALDQLNLSINVGDYIALMGQSGSGKSTALNILGCLMKPTSGRYFFSDKEISHYSKLQLSDIRKHFIGFIFQSFNLIDHLTVEENVMLPLLYQKKSKIEAKERAFDVLKSVDMYDRRLHLPDQISGGQRQRVAIARALVHDPQLIIADEPTGNLDSHTQEDILSIFRKINEQGRTLVIVTHSPFVARNAKRIVVLNDGRKSADFDYSDFSNTTEVSF